MCPVCKGRGEVEAGITFGFVRTGMDMRGNPTGYPTKIRPNPAAQDSRGTIWIIQRNSECELWGIAICVACHGSGVLMRPSPAAPSTKESE